MRNTSSKTPVNTSLSSYSSPFGVKLRGRTFEDSTYRQNFNGKESDIETQTEDYGMRIYDADLALFQSVDPLTRKFPELTPYQFAGNSPILNIDLDGLEPLSYNFAGELRNMFGNGFVGLGAWMDNTFSRTSTTQVGLAVAKVKLGPVTNETTVKTTTTTTQSYNFTGIFGYIVATNSTEGCKAPLTTQKSDVETEVENKTSYAVTNGTNKMTIYNSTSATTDGKKITNTTGVIAETVVEGIPVVAKTSVSVDSKGTTTTTVSGGVGNAENNINVSYKQTESQSGTTNSVGVGAEGSLGPVSGSQDEYLNVDSKKTPPQQP